MNVVHVNELLPRKTRNDTKMKNKGWDRMDIGIECGMMESIECPFPVLNEKIREEKCQNS